MMGKKGKHVRSAYITLFGGSFRTAQRTDMRKKGERLHFFFFAFQDVPFFGGSFRTAQLTDMRKKRGARAFFLHFKTSHFFCGGLFDRHNAQEKKEGMRVFLPFLPECTQKSQT